MPGWEAAAAPREDWEELDEEFGEENVGQWSPQPVPVSEIRGLEVVSQAGDERMLQLLRTQVGCHPYAGPDECPGACRMPEPAGLRTTVQCTC